MSSTSSTGEGGLEESSSSSGGIQPSCCDDLGAQGLCQADANCTWVQGENEYCRSLCVGLDNIACAANPVCFFVGGPDDACVPGDDVGALDCGG